MVVNDPISNPINKADDFCNVIINTSNDIAKDIGVTYGEQFLSIVQAVRDAPQFLQGEWITCGGWSIMKANHYYFGVSFDVVWVIHDDCWQVTFLKKSSDYIPIC